MTAQPATLAYTIHTAANFPAETWEAPERPGQMRRRAIVTFPDATRPATAAVDLYRDATRTGGKAGIPLQAARFMAKCHVEWAHPDDAGSCVVLASSPEPTADPDAAALAAYHAQAARNRAEDEADGPKPIPVGIRLATKARRRWLNKE